MIRNTSIYIQKGMKTMSQEEKFKEINLAHFHPEI